MRALFAAALLFASAAAAEPVVIVNAKNSATPAREAAKRMLLGEELDWPAGHPVEVVEVHGDDPAVAGGYLELTLKTLAQVRAAWNRLVFSGQANPPQRLGTATEVVAAVSARQWAIAIVDRAAAGPGVRIVLSLGESR